MLKNVLVFTGVILLGAIAWIWLQGGEEKTMVVSDLPWQIEVFPDGSSEVFSVHLGKTSLDEMSRHLDKAPEMALFVGVDGPTDLEAWYGKTRVGVFDAKVVAHVAASQQQLVAFEQNAGDPEPMPSGSWRRNIGERDYPEVIMLPIDRITYIPSVHYETDIAEKRFGKPAEIISEDEQSDYWFYPEKGLVLMMNQEGKEVLQYVRPDHFDVLRQGILDELSQKKAETPAS